MLAPATQCLPRQGKRGGGFDWGRGVRERVADQREPGTRTAAQAWPVREAIVAITRAALRSIHTRTHARTRERMNGPSGPRARLCCV